MASKRVENDAYGAFTVRTVMALGRRCADGDVEDLELIRFLMKACRRAETIAISGLRQQGYSWAEIGKGLGITRQSAQELFVRALVPTEDGDTQP
jgi:hypothetical protein